MGHGHIGIAEKCPMVACGSLANAPFGRASAPPSSGSDRGELELDPPEETLRLATSQTAKTPSGSVMSWIHN